MTPEQNVTNHEVKTELKKYDVLEVDITAAAQKYFGGKNKKNKKHKYTKRRTRYITSKSRKRKHR